MMSRHVPDSPFDFTVHDQTGRLKAVVEAKRRLALTRSWAAEFRGNLLSHGRLPPVGLFVIVAPDRIFVWKGSDPPDMPPIEVDARSLLAPYFQRIGVAPEQIQPMAFEMLVAWWLRDLAGNANAENQPELIRSGLLDAVAGAQVSHEAVA